ncbi:TPA: glycosyltransferase [Vibrio cholerae]
MNKIISKINARLIRYLRRDKLIVLGKGVSIRKKKVLISYLEPEVYLSDVNPNHSNVNDYVVIVNAFLELGFEVHLAYCCSLNKSELLGYDVIFGFGEAFYRACNSNGKALKILYCTESSPNFSYEKECERVSEFNKMYSKNEKLIRTHKYFTNEMLEISDIIIIIGNESVLDTFSYVNKPKYSGIYPSALINQKYNKYQKKPGYKNSFLWFGSTGVVHKGLHLAIHAINQRPDFKLYVAGANKKERKKMPESTNTIYLGRIDVQSDEFINLINNCSAFILPSCSEAGSTATTTCLAHGLLPITTKEVGVALPIGFEHLSSDKFQHILERMDEVSTMNDLEYRHKHDILVDYARSNFSIGKFENEFKELILKVMDDHKTWF